MGHITTKNPALGSVAFMERFSKYSLRYLYRRKRNVLYEMFLARSLPSKPYKAKATLKKVPLQAVLHKV